MKFTAQVKQALEILKANAETNLELNLIAEFESNLNLLSKEIWRGVAGYEGLYKVSNFGRVKSFHGKRKCQTRF